MKIVVQRAKGAQVVVSKDVVGQIDTGLLLLVGITHDDTIDDCIYLANKIAKMRIFEDENEKMNLSIKDVDGKILSISQFTLYADTKKGNRPSFVNAAKPEYANDLYEKFNELLRNEHQLTVETGQFGAMMDVSFTNVGPVTIIIDSKDR